MAGHDALLSFGGFEPWKRAVELLLGALRRRRLSIALLVLAFTAVGTGAAALLPRTYTAETRLLVKKNYMMPALASPRRAVPLGSEAPLQSAAEFVLSHDSLHSIVERQRLVERWDAERAPILRAKDRVMGWVRGPLSNDAKRDAIVELLGARIKVLPQDDIIRVKATWGHPDTVVDVVNGALETFLDARRKMDVQAIADTHAVLEGFTERARARVDKQLALLVRARRATPVSSPAVTPASRPRQVRAPARAEAPVLSDGLGPLRNELRSAIGRRTGLEREHETKVAAVEARLAERRTVLTDRHPEIQGLQRDLERISQEPPALVAARQDEQRLRADYAARGGREEQLAEPEAVAIASEPAADVEADVAAAGELAPVRRVNGRTMFATRAHATSGDAELEQRHDDAFAVLASGATDETTERLALEDLTAEAAPADDDLADYGRALLKNALDSYQDLRTRLANVQIELETAQAAFNYRYAVTVPARVPRDPDSPNVPFVVLGGLIAGLVAGIALAVFAELRARSLLSPQALGRHLGFLQEPATE